jgi:hypothetical protein
MNIPDHISESLETIFWVKILKFFDADADKGIFLTLDPGSGMEKIRIGDNIPDPQHYKKLWSRASGEQNKTKIQYGTLGRCSDRKCLNSVKVASEVDERLIIFFFMFIQRRQHNKYLSNKGTYRCHKKY